MDICMQASLCIIFLLSCTNRSWFNSLTLPAVNFWSIALPVSNVFMSSVCVWVCLMRESTFVLHPHTIFFLPYSWRGNVTGRARLSVGIQSYTSILIIIIDVPSLLWPVNSSGTRRCKCRGGGSPGGANRRETCSVASFLLPPRTHTPSLFLFVAVSYSSPSPHRLNLLCVIYLYILKCLKCLYA